MLSSMSWRCVWASLKGKNGLAQSLAPNRLPHPVGRRQIDFRAKQIAKAAFKTAHRHQRDSLRRVKICQKIDIGMRRGLTSGNGSKKPQVDNTCRLQLGSMLAQNTEDAILIHKKTVTHSPRPGNKLSPPCGIAALPEVT